MDDHPIWDKYPHIWPTKAAFFAYLRGALRKAVWNRWPGKIIVKNRDCSPPPEGVETRATTGAHCSLSGEWVGKSMLQVDHIEGNASLNDWDDLVGFVQHLCADVNDLQLVSPEAHKIKSYADRMGISYEEATIAKKQIAFNKLKKPAKLAYFGLDKDTKITVKELNSMFTEESEHI